LRAWGFLLFNVKEGGSQMERPPSSIIEAGEQISARIGDALLGLFLGRCCRLRWELKHGCLLTVAKHRQQDDAPVRKFKRIMVRPRLLLVDLTKDGHCLIDGQFS
jgi:hypothetical protein